jgi:hypothetical protein
LAEAAGYFSAGAARLTTVSRLADLVALSQARANGSAVGLRKFDDEFQAILSTVK